MPQAALKLTLKILMRICDEDSNLNLDYEIWEGGDFDQVPKSHQVAKFLKKCDLSSSRNGWVPRWPHPRRNLHRPSDFGPSLEFR